MGVWLACMNGESQTFCHPGHILLKLIASPLRRFAPSYYIDKDDHCLENLEM